MENGRMTIPQVIEVTRDLLRGIAVPAGLIETIGMQILHAAQNLDMCLDAWKAAQEKETAEEGPEDETANG